ncbi:MAG: hypothetical protein HZY76_02570 [Anaerolineae bacterium]|nr:MAG: hypothetical protein HZY76_02570 [Anaerolineae bacterium]
MHNQTIHFTLNDVSITCTVPPHWSLHDALRTVDAAAERPDPCPAGDCCRCTVLLDGRGLRLPRFGPRGGRPHGTHTWWTDRAPRTASAAGLGRPVWQLYRRVCTGRDRSPGRLFG